MTPQYRLLARQPNALISLAGPDRDAGLLVFFAELGVALLDGFREVPGADPVADYLGLLV